MTPQRRVGAGVASLQVRNVLRSNLSLFGAVSIAGVVMDLVGMPGVAAAANPSARLTYVRSMDAASCPDEGALRRAVAVRFGYDPFFPWAKKTVIVHIGHERQHFVARVELVDDGGLTRGTRDLHADDADCAQIFDATALAISIALDAFATSGEAEPPVTAPEGPLPREAAVAPPPPAPLPAPPPPPLESASSIVPQRSATPFVAGADVLGALGVAPGPALGIGVFVAARARPASIELGLRAAASTPTTLTPVGRVETARFVASLAPCARFGVGFACGIAELGWLRAWSSGLDFPASAATLVVTAGARIGLALPISQAVVFRIYAEGAFDLDRAQFELDYQPHEWTAPPLEGTLAIGLGRRIP